MNNKNNNASDMKPNLNKMAAEELELSWITLKGYPYLGEHLFFM